MTKTLGHDDIRKFLTNFSAAIELDQRRVDALPAADFILSTTTKCGAPGAPTI